MFELDPQIAFSELGSLVSAMPNLRDVNEDTSTPDATIQWLAELEAIVAGMGVIAGISEMELKVATANLIRTRGASAHAAEIKLIALRCLAIARSRAPAAARGAFIPTGADFDAFAALNGIFKSARRSILVVDPYLDESALSRFAILANEEVSIALLADEKGVRPDLEPAAQAWIRQHGAKRRLAVRIAPARALHDRALLTDAADAWILTQSLKDFAARSPAIVQRVDPALAQMKLDAYSDIWNSARVLVEAA